VSLLLAGTTSRPLSTLLAFIPIIAFASAAVVLIIVWRRRVM
jgi:hypothetical protein